MAAGERVHAIPVYREMTVEGGAVALDGYIEAIEGLLEPPWSRDREHEQSPRLAASDYRIFERSDSPESPGLLIFLTVRGADLYVPNIVPTTRSELSKGEYNAALEEFETRFARPAADQLDLNVVLGSDRLDLRDVIGDEALSALSTFSAAANKSTGSGHPLDQERWFEFIWRVHHSGRDLQLGLLHAWLTMDGWSDELAGELTSEFDFGIGLLGHVSN